MRIGQAHAEQQMAVNPCCAGRDPGISSGILYCELMLELSGLCSAAPHPALYDRSYLKPVRYPHVSADSGAVVLA